MAPAGRSGRASGPASDGQVPPECQNFGPRIAVKCRQNFGQIKSESRSNAVRRKAQSAARRFADRWQSTYPKAVACLRSDLDELLTCFRYRTLDERKQVRTTNAIERRFREVRRRTRPMGTFQDRTSMDRVLYAVFIHENKSQGISTPVSLTHNS